MWTRYMALSPVYAWKFIAQVVDLHNGHGLVPTPCIAEA